MLCELGQQLNQIHHARRPDIFVAETTDFQRDEPHWRSSVEADNQAAFIAELDAEPVGFITLQLQTPTSPLLQPTSFARINSVCVNETARGQGIGRALMRLAESWAQQQGASDLRLNVWAFNARAMRLYEELGYEVRAVEMGKTTAPE